MSDYVDGILSRAGEQASLLFAAQTLLTEPSRGACWARLGFSAALALLLTVIPAQCSALLC